VGSECISVFTVDILRPVVVISHRIADLPQALASHLRIPRRHRDTYMHIYPLAIPSKSIQYSRHNHQLLLRNKVPDAPFVLGGIVLLDGVEVEFEGRGEGEGEQQECEIEQSQQPVHGCECGTCGSFTGGFWVGLGRATPNGDGRTVGSIMRLAALGVSVGDPGHVSRDIWIKGMLEPHSLPSLCENLSFMFDMLFLRAVYRVK